jgi:methylated-DNA-[protein]-cysteine S-methyltransferase
MTESGNGKYCFHYEAPIGRMTAYSDGNSLTGLDFDGQKTAAVKHPEEYAERPDLPVFMSTKAWLDRYFGGQIPDSVPPLHLHGTLFQSAVWSILLQIPYGGTMTYGEIAERIRQEKKLPHMSAQAVGQAVGHNPVSIIVPCHRVIGSDGSLTGYAGGLDRKEWMLALEKEKKRCSEKCGGSHRN